MDNPQRFESRTKFPGMSIVRLRCQFPGTSTIFAQKCVISDEALTELTHNHNGITGLLSCFLRVAEDEAREKKLLPDDVARVAPGKTTEIVVRMKIEPYEESGLPNGPVTEHKQG